MIWFALEPGIKYLLLAALLAAALLVFGLVKAEYRRLRRLSTPVAALQTAYFLVYALTSYVFLDSRLNHLGVRGLLLAISLILMGAGVLVVALSMPFLGRQSFGRYVGPLRTGGLYQFSRNPQLVGSFLFVVGYALLWPSFQGFLWAGLWLVVSHLMVQAEEAHLRNVFGEQYKEYCSVTPRYLGIPRQSSKARGRPT